MLGGRGEIDAGCGGETRRKRPLESHRHKWEDNIKIDLAKIGWERVDNINVPQGMNKWRTLVNTVMNIRVPQNAGNFLTELKAL